ncbi:hypothetical protein DFH09DRAFT_1105086 [Mycena vulgaris]|nr:hypothetical protein DFH09DRAFT_1105086 [Mycena vulgaris]
MRTSASSRSPSPASSTPRDASAQTEDLLRRVVVNCGRDDDDAPVQSIERARVSIAFGRWSAQKAGRRASSFACGGELHHPARGGSLSRVEESLRRRPGPWMQPRRCHTVRGGCHVIVSVRGVDGLVDAPTHRPPDIGDWRRSGSEIGGVPAGAELVVEDARWARIRPAVPVKQSIKVVGKRFVGERAKEDSLPGLELGSGGDEAASASRVKPDECARWEEGWGIWAEGQDAPEVLRVIRNPSSPYVRLSEARVLGYPLIIRQTTFIGWRSGEVLAAGKCTILTRGDGVARRRGTAKSEIHFKSGDTPDQDIVGQRRADARVEIRGGLVDVDGSDRIQRKGVAREI